MRQEYHQPRSSIREPREYLLKGSAPFVRSAAEIPGVVRIALIGSLATPKKMPKDIDFLVTVNDSIDFKQLASAGRKLQGYAHQINLTADIFIADDKGRYLGRTCRYREPWHRANCVDRVCASMRFAIEEEKNPPGNHLKYLCDDTGSLVLESGLIKTPPLIVWPEVRNNAAIPDDVNTFLADSFRKAGL